MTDTKRTIVVVDDDTEMNQALERLLSAAGFRAATFLSAEAMLGDAAGMRADCFILDVQLPGASGFELQRQIALRGVAKPVIFITARDDAATRGQAQALGAAAYFAKPFNGQQLLAAIAGALECCPAVR